MAGSVSTTSAGPLQQARELYKKQDPLPAAVEYTNRMVNGLPLEGHSVIAPGPLAKLLQQDTLAKGLNAKSPTAFAFSTDVCRGCCVPEEHASYVVDLNGTPVGVVRGAPPQPAKTDWKPPNSRDSFG